MEKSLTVTLDILRGHRDPESGKIRQERKTYTLEIAPSSSILDALEKLRLGREPGLAYRHSCHHASCGTCSMLINGEPRLACITRIDSLPTGTPIRLDPLPGMELTRDLAVNPEGFYTYWVHEWPSVKTHEVNGEDVQQLESCIECGICNAACPEYRPPQGFMGPAVLAAIHRRYEETGILPPQATSEEGVAACKSHFNCSRACPRGVAPGKRITVIRRNTGI